MSQPNPQAELRGAYEDYILEEFGANANNTDWEELCPYSEWLEMRHNSDVRVGEE